MAGSIGLGRKPYHSYIAGLAKDLLYPIVHLELLSSFIDNNGQLTTINFHHQMFGEFSTLDMEVNIFSLENLGEIT